MPAVQYDPERDILLIRSILEQSSEPIVATDPEGRVILHSLGMERLFGYSGAELRSASLHQLTHHHRPDGTLYPESECPWQHALRSGVTVLDREDLFFHKDGTPIEILGSCRPLLAGERHLGLLVTLRDLREKRKTEQALRESEERSSGTEAGEYRPSRGRRGT